MPADRARLERDPFCLTHRVSIEISTQCNFVRLHKKCPLHLDYAAEVEKGGGYASYLKNARVLPDKVIERCLMTLAKHAYEKSIAFHRYNEPLIDVERLTRLVQFARRACPRSDIVVYTAGAFLTLDVANGLIAAGATRFFASGYSKEFYDRLSGIFENMSKESTTEAWPVRGTVHDFIGGGDDLDDRLTLYDRAARGEVRTPENPSCLAPLRAIEIASTGDVVLCCLDWQNRFAFGNVQEQQLDEIVLRGGMIEAF